MREAFEILVGGRRQMDRPEGPLSRAGRPARPQSPGSGPVQRILAGSRGNLRERPSRTPRPRPTPQKPRRGLLYRAPGHPDGAQSRPDGPVYLRDHDSTTPVDRYPPTTPTTAAADSPGRKPAQQIHPTVASVPRGLRSVPPITPRHDATPPNPQPSPLRSGVPKRGKVCPGTHLGRFRDPKLLLDRPLNRPLSN